MSSYDFTPWAGPRPPAAEEIERRLRAEGLEPYTAAAPRAAGKEWHSLPQVRWVASGSLTMEVDGARVRLGPGDRIDMQPGVELSVEDSTDAVLVCAARWAGGC